MPIFFNTITATNVAQAMTGSNTRFSNATFYGYSGFISGIAQSNVNSVYLGKETGKLGIAITANSYAGYSAKDDLINFYMIGRAGDGIYGILS